MDDPTDPSKDIMLVKEELEDCVIIVSKIHESLRGTIYQDNSVIRTIYKHFDKLNAMLIKNRYSGFLKPELKQAFKSLEKIKLRIVYLRKKYFPETALKNKFDKLLKKAEKHIKKAEMYLLKFPT